MFQLSLSRKDLLQQHMASVLNTSLEYVDIFTVARAPENATLIDVRFSAHGSPYYAPEKLNSKVNLSSDEVNPTTPTLNTTNCNSFSWRNY